MPLEPEVTKAIANTIQEAVSAAQEKLAQLLAKQFLEIRQEIQEVHESLRKSSNRQIQIEADVGDVNCSCEFLKRRLQEIHDDLTERDSHPRNVSQRLDQLEREVTEIRQRLASAI